LAVEPGAGVTIEVAPDAVTSDVGGLARERQVPRRHERQVVGVELWWAVRVVVEHHPRRRLIADLVAVRPGLAHAETRQAAGRPIWLKVVSRPAPGKPRERDVRRHAVARR